MSSEVYARWRIQNLEAVNQRLKQQLAAERQRQAEQLRQLAGAVRSIGGKIASARGTAETSPGAALRRERISNVTDFAAGDVKAEGFDEGAIGSLEIRGAGNGVKVRLKAVDWSGQLEVPELECPPRARKTAYAQAMENHLSAAAAGSPEETGARNQFVSYMNGLLEDDGLDFDYFKSLVDRRFEQLKEQFAIPDPGEADESRLTYCALCSMAGVKPRSLKRAELEAEVERMKRMVLEREKEAYVYRNLREVFDELGMSIQDEFQLDGLDGHRVVDDGITDCSVFMSLDGDGIIFETVAEADPAEALSAGKKARIEESAHAICQKHAEVIRRMEQRGIVLQVECEERPRAERMRRVNMSGQRRLSRQKSQELHMGDK